MIGKTSAKPAAGLSGALAEAVDKRRRKNKSRSSNPGLNSDYRKNDFYDYLQLLV
jgi:hypothetical protein